MEAEDCWMSFSEALAKYLEAREGMKSATSQYLYDLAESSLKEAAEHMDALAPLPTIKKG